MTTLTNDPKVNIGIVKTLAGQQYPDKPVLADLTAAQAILESRLEGQPSELAVKYNNLFGIKGIGTHGMVMLPTHEYVNGEMKEVLQGFANNLSLIDSFAQHQKLLNLPRYANVLTAQTLEDAALQIRLAGYATDPSYTQSLIDVYNRDLK